MPNSEIITIGTELLLGEITDTNSTYIARTLRDHGIDIFRITTIGDNPNRIAKAIREALSRAEIIITTGGLGPTIDDPTRQAVADATFSKLVFHPDLWDEIRTYFKDSGRIPTENNRRQAFIPHGAILIKNPVGTAPCFIVENGVSCVISLPGVPSEMKYLLHNAVIPYLKEKFQLQTRIIKATVLHAASMGESFIDEKIGDLEQLSNPTVGLLAHPGQVDIRVTVKAESELEALELLKPLVKEIKSRLGENIYGQDQDTLESVISRFVNQHHLKLCVGEFGFEESLLNRLRCGHPDHLNGIILEKQPENAEELAMNIREKLESIHYDVLFGSALIKNLKISCIFYYQDQYQQQAFVRVYGGPEENALLWAQNTSLDFLRRQLTLIDGN